MNQNTKRWALILLAIPLFLVAALDDGAVGRRVFSSRPSSESLWTAPSFSTGVRAELVQMQATDGLTIGWLEHDGPVIVKFDKRAVIRGRLLPGQSVGGGTISRDGSQIALMLHDAPFQVPILGIVRADGSDLREFSNLEGAGPRGWSYDMSRLAMTVLNARQTRLSLEVLDLASKSVTDIAVLTSLTALTTQCWSPDGKAIVFETDGHVAIQNLGEPKPTILTDGTDPTWSPDGNWIAYLDKNEQSYYIIHPSGEGKKKLFHSRHGMPGLYWSPDSRIVAYVVEEGFLFMDVETYRLRVRRIEDNSDDWVANEDIGCCYNLQWVTNKALIARIESANHHVRIR
ncbi:MAG: TolB family protein [Candidatus Acidiferrales bacterium]